MLGLGSNLTKGGAGAKTIVTDSLVLKHNYALSPVQPLSDGAAYFVGQEIDLGSKSGLGSSTTITAWVWAKDVTSNGAIITFGDTMVRFDSSTSLEVFPDVGGSASTGTFNDIIGRWVHVAATMTINGSNCDVLIYEDGALIKAETETSVPSTDSRVSSIGSYSGGSFWSGYICNVGLWNATLSQAQIKSIMNKNYAGLTASEKTDLVSWWNLDSVIPDTTTLVYDNHHGDGDTLGSELVTDNFVGWSTTGDVAITDGKVVFTDANEYTETRNTSGDYLVSGNTYKLVIDIESQSGTGDLAYRYDGGGVTTITGGAGVKTVYFTAPSNGEVWIQTNGTPTNLSAVINSVSVKLVNGNTGTLS
tara:strand:- start:604 stop:1689 length:1086 start_codon:yes stop_codon:yes gene_type:complete